VTGLVVPCTSPAAWVATGFCVVALVPAGLRWLRVAQREHYLPGAPSRFAWRWWTSDPENVACELVAVAGFVASLWWAVVAIVPALFALVTPLHLSLLGRTGRLRWTRRLATLAGVWVVLQAALVGVGVAVGAPALLSAIGVLAVPFLVDAACVLTVPLEHRIVGRYVDQARRRLAVVHPTIVGITGSYGKTSTKHHVAHLVTGTREVVASPASFNNRAGLARAVNEQLRDGTEVFVAEMGTYGPGEIAALCSWCPPRIAVLTAIGPVHLERFGTEERIVAAKAEITESVDVVVLNADDDRLRALAGRLEGLGRARVVRCSGRDAAAAVAVLRDGERWSVFVGGERIVGDEPVVSGIQPTNLACAIAVAIELGVPAQDLPARVRSLPVVANRLSTGQAASGVIVIDDTYNSNPAGTRAALGLLAAADAPRRRVVVTPGMVELGRRQDEENRSFASAAAEFATDFVAVGRTNRRALLDGAAPLGPLWMRTREEAVRWVRTHLGIDDAILYENDLPDHYP
jgi:UDP-N-acetylmuramoyl-tripeptide--D-alanyl-D-alanine ligase